MTPAEARTALFAIKREIGPDTDIYLGFNRVSEHATFPKVLHCGVYPEGIGKASGSSFSAQGDDWEELIADVRRLWAELKDSHRARAIRHMALEIIRVTADQGECTDQALRGDGKYSVGQIKAYGAEACVEANAIAGKGPFQIRFKHGANAPTDGVLAS